MESIDLYKLRIENIIKKHSLFMLRPNNIFGVGRGNKIINGNMTNEPTLTFFVKQKISSNLLNEADKIPKYFHGIKTDVIDCPKEMQSKEKTPSLQKMVLPSDKPALAGGILYIIDEPGYLKSTLGAVVTDKKTRENVYFLTSRHFVDTKNDFVQAQKNIFYSKDLIPIINYEDFYKKTWLLGKGFRVSKYSYRPKNNKGTIQSVDAALGYVEKNIPETKKYILPQFVDGKSISGIEPPTIGDVCYKVGGVTGYLEFQVVTLKTDIKVDSGLGTTNFDIYTNQIAIKASTINVLHGDSGSLLINKKTNNAIGMLNSGANSISHCSYMNSVFDDLKIELL